ncbi:hypothetical protein I302_108765 [Kwoniella bestiolae CBS 10118]|uniref:Uncharacterized protein n=1 Tax=Kwoniella bestiolae CBS 10118 TaxID=1296100 RepID=A0A1B9FU07_9TREE|nr:hypothetical protein I302_07902 [Kwoniella bestiolae CBS 10118]OCF22257.1 hypothetical protein I302_07902 [Kwoniella bestiolae CBS 10118]
MSSRSNYLLIQTPFYSLLTFPAPPSPRPNTSDKLPLPLPRQRTRKTRARGLSILIPPPTERLQKRVFEWRLSMRGYDTLTLTVD